VGQLLAKVGHAFVHDFVARQAVKIIVKPYAFGVIAKLP
jgi:hypothetical protein